MIDDTTEGWGTQAEPCNHRIKEVEIRALEGCGGMNLWVEYESGESCIVRKVQRTSGRGTLTLRVSTNLSKHCVKFHEVRDRTW